MLVDRERELKELNGMTTFEELCREWVLVKARQGQLPFAVEQVGSHWDRQVQVDVAAISWREKALLLGEAKWQTEPVSCAIVRELFEVKTPKVRATLPDEGEGWRITYACFSRAGFTEAARELAGEHDALLVDLPLLDQVLSELT